MKYRTERLNSQIQRVLADIINNRLKDPRINQMVSVLGVETAKDLSVAKVTVSIFGDDNSETFKALQSCSSFIRKELSQELKDIRQIPQLSFVLDTSMEYSKRINELLNEIKKS